MHTTSSYLPIFGVTVAVSLLALFYYEKRRCLDQVIGNIWGEGDTCKDTDEVHETEIADAEDENEEPVHVKASSSGNSYSSFDDDDIDMRSCRATSSSTSAYSTASDDMGPFPVGEISTYKQNNVDTNIQNLDLHEILNSPVVENHITDERMNRSPAKHSEFEQYYNSADENSPLAVESTNVKTIVMAYNDIVPPLRPNTGEIIHSPNVSGVR